MHLLLNLYISKVYLIQFLSEVVLFVIRDVCQDSKSHDIMVAEITVLFAGFCCFAPYNTGIHVLYPQICWHQANYYKRPTIDFCVSSRSGRSKDYVTGCFGQAVTSVTT